MDSKALTPTTRTYEVRGLPLAYHVWGAEDAPTILCFHGFLDHGQSFAPVAELLQDDFRIIAVDFRGHGHSGWIGAGGYYHFHDYFTDVLTLVEHLGIERTSIIAHSMGGSVASGVASMAPDRFDGIIMLEGMGPPASSFDHTVMRLTDWWSATSERRLAGDVAHRRAARTKMANLDAAAERLRRINPLLPLDRALRFAASFSEPDDETGDQVVWRYDPLHRTPGPRGYYVDEVRQLWRAIKAPVLSLFGEMSRFPNSVEERHAEIKDVRIASVPGVGHNIHHDRPDLVAAAARSWFVDGERRLATGLVDAS